VRYRLSSAELGEVAPMDLERSRPAAASC